MSNVIIARAGEEELPEVLGFVQNRYKTVFNTRPAFIAQDCFVARHEGRMVGVLASEFSDGGSFEVENYFDIDFSMLSFDRLHAVSFSRWISDMAFAAPALAYAAIGFAISKGRTHSFSCAKPALMNHLRRRYGLPIDRFFVPIREGQVLPEDRGFFLEDPRPGLYVGVLVPCYNVLKGKLSSLVEIR